MTTHAPPTGTDPAGWMRWAFVLAEDAAVRTGDVPVAALILDQAGALVSTGVNERELTGDPLAHAEIVAIRAAAARRGTWRLDGCTLLVTLEPCVMCAGAILAARVSTVVYGAWDEKAGAVGSVYDVMRDRRLPHRVEVVAGVEADAAASMLQRFFGARREPPR